MQRRPARFRGVRYTPCPELLEDRRLLAEILRPHLHELPPDPPAGQAAPGFRGEIRAVATAWQAGAPIPLARTEVAAAVVAGEIVVIGGFLVDGSSSSRVDAYSIAAGTWRRLPDLPVGVNHAAAASDGRRLYVIGGYGGPIGGAALLRSAFVLERGQWQPLPGLPEARAAAGAAIVRGRIYVVGGVGPRGLATGGFAYDLRSGRWSAVPGPTPREHLAVTALGGRVYALGGRLAGLDTNLGLLESYAARCPALAKLAAGPAAARRYGRGGVPRQDRLGRGRSDRRDHRERLRLQRRQASLATARRPPHATPRARCRRGERARLCDRRWAESRPLRERCERVAAAPLRG